MPEEYLPWRLCVSRLSQGAVERPPVLRRARRYWRAEQPARPDHDAGARFPSGPGHRPVPGAEERGTAASNTTRATGERFTPAFGKVQGDEPKAETGRP